MKALLFFAVAPAATLAFLPIARRPTFKVKTAPSMWISVPDVSPLTESKDEFPDLDTSSKHCIPLEGIDLDDLPKVGGYVLENSCMTMIHCSFIHFSEFDFLTSYNTIGRLRRSVN
jgi:hypothetical protein